MIIGDNVVLKAGGPIMTVLSIRKEEKEEGTGEIIRPEAVQVAYFLDNLEYKSLLFPLDALCLVSEYIVPKKNTVRKERINKNVPTIKKNTEKL